MITASPKTSAFVSGEEPRRQIQYQDSHNNHEEHAQDVQAELTRESIACTKTTQHLCTSVSQERQSGVTGIRQELLALEEEFIELKTEFNICKHVLKERLRELQKIAEFMERDTEELRREFERSKQAAKEQLVELNRLRAEADYVGRCKDDLRGNFAMDKQAAEEDIEELREPRDLNKKERRESGGNSFFKQVKGWFGKKSGRSKRKLTAAQPRNQAGGDNTPTMVRDWPTNLDGHSRRSSISGVFTFSPNHRRSIRSGIQCFELFPFDEDELNMTKDEPIDIDSQPKSQKKEEGSRVEFQFKVRGKYNLMYQWFKDGSELPRQNNDTLVLECIQLRDFGKYTCKVSYEDRCCVPVKSNSAKLDVIPTESRSGTKLKLLQDVDFHTREELTHMLENDLYSLGGWRQVAAEYGMRERKISGLTNSKEPGKNVIEFLGGFHPDLTVYSFCKVLKHYNIKRFDIVKFLEDHFLVADGTESVSGSM